MDLVVNIFNLAYHKRKISIFGGNQLRPNIHIDMVRAYETLITSPDEKVSGEIFNGYHNHTVSELGNIVKSKIGNDVVLETIQSNDNRSFIFSSEKIKKKLGFNTTKNIGDAVLDLKTLLSKIYCKLLRQWKIF